MIMNIYCDFHLTKNSDIIVLCKVYTSYQLSNFDERITEIYTPVQIFSLSVSYL